METFRVPHHFARKDKFQSGCHCINLVTGPDFPLVLSLQSSFLITRNLFYAIAERKGGCMFFYEAVFTWIHRAQCNKLVWRGIYGQAEKSVQKGFSFTKEEIRAAIARNLVYCLLCHVALTAQSLEKNHLFTVCVMSNVWIANIISLCDDSRFSTVYQKIPRWHWKCWIWLHLVAKWFVCVRLSLLSKTCNTEIKLPSAVPSVRKASDLQSQWS